LFSEGGNIDLSRLQLFGFTIIGIMVYIYNVYTGNPLEGMPDVPSTLLGLMGVSQTGYIGPKALVDKVSVNYVTPKDIVIYQYNSTMNIIGSGFTSGTKVMIEGYDPIPAQFNSPSSLSIPLPTFVETKKSVSITILPPNGSSIIIEDAFHIVAEKPVVMPENLDDDHNSDYMTKDAPPENLGEPESQIEPVKEV
jgi:hypothetical protein